MMYFGHSQTHYTTKHTSVSHFKSHIQDMFISIIYFASLGMEDNINIAIDQLDNQC